MGEGRNAGLLGLEVPEAVVFYGVGQGMPSLSFAVAVQESGVCVQQLCGRKKRVAVAAFWFGFPCKVGLKSTKKHESSGLLCCAS